MRKRSIEEQRRRRLLASLAVLLLIPALGLGVMRLLFFSGSAGDESSLDEEVLHADALGGRKNIYDRHFNELATSFRLASVYARPLELQEPEKAAKLLAAKLEVNEDELLASLKAERSFVWVGRQVARETADKIAESNIKGVHVIQRAYRYYPRHDSAAHVVGFVKDEQGLAGLESYYDNILRGGGVYDPALSRATVPAAVVSGKVGAHVVITLDMRIQKEMEGRLQHLIRETRAQSGTAMVMNPANGEILALASTPAYDPNRFWAFTGEERKNRAIAGQVYPGGLRSLFWLAAALEKGGAPGDASVVGAEPVEAQAQAGLLPWHEVQAGVYLSAGMAAVAAPILPAEEKRLFAQRIGLCGESGIDLPEGTIPLAVSDEIAFVNEAEQSLAEPLPPSGCGRIALGNAQAASDAVSLLAAFCRVAVGGPVAPHLLYGLSDGQQLWPVPPAIDTVKSLPPAVVAEVLTKLHEVRPGGQREPVIVESLIRQDLLVGRDIEAQPGEPNAQPEGVVAPEKPGPSPKGPAIAVKELEKYHAVLLGMAPEAKPDLALIIMLDNAQLNPAKPSPLRGMARDLVAYAGQQTPVKPVPPALAVLAAQETIHYKKWLALYQEPEYQPLAAMVPVSGNMPDVKGYSLRKALQVLQQYGLRLKVAGSGQVVGQQPPPGTPLKGVEQGMIELRMMPAQ